MDLQNRRESHCPAGYAEGLVYILECSDGTYYVGSTTNIEARLWQHQHGPDGAAYTRHRRPVRLVWCGEFATAALTFAFEKQVQGWRRAKREALTRGEFERLPGLSWRRKIHPDVVD